MGTRRLAVRRARQHGDGRYPRHRLSAGHLARTTGAPSDSSCFPKGAATPGGSISIAMATPSPAPTTATCVCLHQVQGGYYVKGFSKHGPLHNPYTYGYFEHCDAHGPQRRARHLRRHRLSGRRFPATFNDTYIGANLLSNAIYYSAIEPRRLDVQDALPGHAAGDRRHLVSPHRLPHRPRRIGVRGRLVRPAGQSRDSRRHLGSLERTDLEDRRPADWPEPANSSWQSASSSELVDLLAHPTHWYRREARRILSERRDATQFAAAADHDRRTFQPNSLALEALWALYVSGGWSETLALELIEHANPDIRNWAVRFVGDDKRELPAEIRGRLVELAAREPDVTVRSQLACTAKRLTGHDGLPIVEKLLARGEDAGDPHHSAAIVVGHRRQGRLRPTAGDRAVCIERGLATADRSLDDHRAAGAAILGRAIERRLCGLRADPRIGALARRGAAARHGDGKGPVRPAPSAGARTARSSARQTMARGWQRSDIDAIGPAAGQRRGVSPRQRSHDRS